MSQKLVTGNFLSPPLFLNKIQANMDRWKMCSLSPMGRINTIKMNIILKFNGLLCILPWKIFRQNWERQCLNFL